MPLRLTILTYLGILLSLVVGYSYLFLSPDNWPDMTVEEARAQSLIFKVVYFSASSGLALVGWIIVSQLVGKSIKGLLRVFVGYLATQFMVDLFSNGEYERYWEYLDHGSAIILVLYSIYSAWLLVSKRHDTKQ
jgi:hypothetical protein